MTHGVELRFMQRDFPLRVGARPSAGLLESGGH